MDSSCDLIGIDVPESLLGESKEEPTMQNDTRIAVDVAKAVFEIAVSDRPGRVSRRERLPRAQFLAFFAQQPKPLRWSWRPAAPPTTGDVASKPWGTA
jgi:hypothetical protein